MSRVAKNPVVIPAGVEVTFTGREITVKGPLGALTQKQNANVRVVQDGKELKVEKITDSIAANAMSGTMRALLANMMLGVSAGAPLGSIWLNWPAERSSHSRSSLPLIFTTFSVFG